MVFPCNTWAIPWSDRSRSFTPEWLTLFKEFVGKWSLSVAVLSVVLVGHLIICPKELEKQNYKKIFVRGSISLQAVYAILLLIFSSSLKIKFILKLVKDTHREKAPSNKTPALRKSTNMGVWAVGTLNQLFIRGS